MIQDTGIRFNFAYKSGQMCVHVYSLVQMDGLVFASPDLGSLSRGPEPDRAERLPKFGPCDTATTRGSVG